MKNALYSSPTEVERVSGRPGVSEGELGRTPFSKDYARLLHAPSFRRLQGKTQLFPGDESDYFRNRLTHSLEVAQIAQGIASRLNAEAVPKAFPTGDCPARIDEDLVRFAAIAHDLGHPPFGHNGEYALDSLMRRHGGFEGNAQTLRILSRVERKLVQVGEAPPTSEFGLDLTYRSLAAVLKYDRRIPVVRRESPKPAKGYYHTEADLVAAIKQRVAPGLPEGASFKTIECAIMDIADDIAYSTYDLEDCLHAGFITPLGLMRVLLDEQRVLDHVTKETTESLAASGHDQLEGEFELFAALMRVFGAEVPPSLAILVEEGLEVNEVHSLLIAVENYTSDRKNCDDQLARNQLTSERVGRLISAVELVPNTDFPQLSSVRMKRDELIEVEVLKHLNYEVVIRSPRLAVVEHRGKEVVQRVFEALAKDGDRLLPIEWRPHYLAAEDAGLSEVKRLVCDFVSCMTDRHAAEMYARLFGGGHSMFKPL